MPDMLNGAEEATMKVAPRRAPFPPEAMDNLKLDAARASVVAMKLPKGWVHGAPKMMPVKCLLRTSASGMGERCLIVDMLDATTTHGVALNSFFLYQNQPFEMDLTLEDGEMITATGVVKECVLISGRVHGVRVEFRPSLEGILDGDGDSTTEATASSTVPSTAAVQSAPMSDPAVPASGGATPDFVMRQLSDLMESVAAIELRQRQQSGSEADLAKTMPDPATVSANGNKEVASGKAGPAAA